MKVTIHIPADSSCYNYAEKFGGTPKSNPYIKFPVHYVISMSLQISITRMRRLLRVISKVMEILLAARNHFYYPKSYIRFRLATI